MDILGSILNSMDKPPSVSDKQKSLIKKQREELLKKQKQEKDMLNHFKAKVEESLNKFMRDENRQRYKFEPMEAIHRSIIHEVAEVAGIPAFSLGEEGVDRYVLVCKKQFSPCEDELAALRRGEAWDPEKARQLALQQELERKELEDETKKKPEQFVPASNYREKYEHLIGREAAKEAARKTHTNKQYGFGAFLHQFSAVLRT
ncbi:sperm-associated antigen 7 isoform X2 [Bacillus rossius redtenbacheri]|uniref:sperm-associated antigen 7 isoform X2 n=1 Tax=Bacillus rossius redtenbacheri TaxID=93214 RepID=UPI002FDCBCBC